MFRLSRAINYSPLSISWQRVNHHTTSLTKRLWSDPGFMFMFTSLPTMFCNKSFPWVWFLSVVLASCGEDLFLVFVFVPQTQLRTQITILRNPNHNPGSRQETRPGSGWEVKCGDSLQSNPSQAAHIDGFPPFSKLPENVVRVFGKLKCCWILQSKQICKEPTFVLYAQVDVHQPSFTLWAPDRNCHDIIHKK